ncbi:hypothetical protein [Ruminococcus sp.]|uniref:hypothetical protein n=1 Tax=Ruminococcus sp. TaxID=41978 RepID=UPI0025DCD34A|nr:hypothetical protein [Ruminococcus sp.]MBQ8965885.1 hypothetical protein [Ruminococcus sp.]
MGAKSNYELGEVEQRLKDYILSQYKSMRKFCMQIDRSYSTIDNMLKRGLLNSSVSLVLYVCDRLGLDIDELFNGKVIEKAETLYPEISNHEIELIRAYRAKPDMQKAVDTLLGIENTNGNIAEDIAKTVENGESIFKKNSIGTK